jgi:23S rRNA (cytosine1962-C5)-methyltransferase
VRYDRGEDENVTEIERLSEVRHRLILRPGRDASVRARHPWVFSGAVDRVESLPGARDGECCDLFDARGEWIARGTLHQSSQIVCRILTWMPGEVIDEPFFERRFEDAMRLRASAIDLTRTNAYRLVNAEGDRLPGLIVDRYGEELVVQSLTAGTSRLQPVWSAALVAVFQPGSIVDKTEHAVRDPALGSRTVGIHGPASLDPIWIYEDGLRFRVNLIAGQKTGFYLDQRENRQLCGRLAKGREVLNAFAYTGAFGIYAARGGATRVVQLESSTWANDEGRLNWEANDLPVDHVEFVREDVFKYLRREGPDFDMIVLDPPPYAKEKGSVERAARAYKDVNLRALRRLRPGGFLLTFSCSQHVDIDLFQKILFGAARDARASCQWLAHLGPGADHPVHLDHPQGEYLKGFLIRLLAREEVARTESQTVD